MRKPHRQQAPQAARQLNYYAITDEVGGLRSQAGKERSIRTGRTLDAVTFKATLVETANETAALTDGVSQTPHEMSFFGSLKAASFLTRPSVKARVRASARPSARARASAKGQSHTDGPIKLQPGLLSIIRRLALLLDLNTLRMSPVARDLSP